MNAMDKEREYEIHPLRKKLIGKAMLIFLGIMLLLTFFSNTINNFSLPKVTCETPVNGAIVKHISGTGTVQARKTLDLYIQTNMRVLEMKVKVGDTVKRGQLLMVLDIRDVENQLADEEDRYAQEKNALEKLLAKDSPGGIMSYNRAVETARQSMELAERTYLNKKALYEVGGETAENLNNALTAWENSKKDYESAKNNKELAVAENQRDVSNARSTLSIQARKISLLKQQLIYASITAPMDGVITLLSFSAGSMANNALPLYRIADITKGFQFMVTVDSDSAAFLARGALADVTIAALEGRVIQGKISEITDNLLERGEKKDVYIDIQADGLLGGESGSVDIFKKLRTYSTLVPNTAIGQENSGSFIYVVKNRRGPLGNEYYVQKASVTIGESDDLKTGITQGLNTQELVVVTSDKPLSDGARVMVSQ